MLSAIAWARSASDIGTYPGSYTLAPGLPEPSPKSIILAAKAAAISESISPPPNPSYYYTGGAPPPPSMSSNDAWIAAFICSWSTPSVLSGIVLFYS